MKIEEFVEKERQYYYDELVEFVEDEEIEWDEVYLESYYSPPFEDTQQYIDFNLIKGAFIALDKVYNQILK